MVPEKFKSYQLKIEDKSSNALINTFLSLWLFAVYTEWSHTFPLLQLPPGCRAMLEEIILSYGLGPLQSLILAWALLNLNPQLVGNPCNHASINGLGLKRKIVTNMFIPAPAFHQCPPVGCLYLPRPTCGDWEIMNSDMPNLGREFLAMTSRPGRQPSLSTPCFPAVQAFQNLPLSLNRYLLEMILWSFAAQVGFWPTNPSLTIFTCNLPPIPTSHSWKIKIQSWCQLPEVYDNGLALSTSLWKWAPQLFTQSPYIHCCYSHWI